MCRSMGFLGTMANVKANERKDVLFNGINACKNVAKFMFLSRWFGVHKRGNSILDDKAVEWLALESKCAFKLFDVWSFAWNFDLIYCV